VSCRARKSATGLLDDLVSDGATYCALVQNATGPAAVFVDPHGTPLATVPLPAAEDHEILPRNGGGYTVVMAGNGEISLLAVTAAGAGTVRRIANVPGVKDVAAIAGGNHILLAWYPDSRLAWLVLDASGNAIGAPALMRYDFIATPVLAWDGREFLIARDSGVALHALSVGTDGVMRSSAPFRIAGHTWGFAFGFDGSRALLVTAEDLDVRARRIESFTSIGEQPGAVIAFSGESQSMQAATAADGTLLTIGEDLRGIVHRPDGTKRRIDLRTGGSTLSDVIAAGDVFLVVAGGVGGHVAWRVRSDGAVLGSEPIALPFGAEAEAATDGRDFFRVWPEPNGVYGQHLTATGAQPRFAIAAPRNYAVGDVHAAWTGTAYVVVWGEGVNGQMYARVPAGPQTLAVRKSDGPRGLAIGSNGNGALAVWVDEYCIMTSPLSREGIPQGAPRRVRCGVPLSNSPQFEMVWDGAAYTIVWSVDDSLPRVMAVRVLADGTPVSEVETVVPRRPRAGRRVAAARRAARARLPPRRARGAVLWRPARVLPHPRPGEQSPADALRATVTRQRIFIAGSPNSTSARRTSPSVVARCAAIVASPRVAPRWRASTSVALAAAWPPGSVSVVSAQTPTAPPFTLRSSDSARLSW
jgi:hypothetical protein